MNYNTKMFLEENYQSVLWIQLVSRRKKKNGVCTGYTLARYTHLVT